MGFGSEPEGDFLKDTMRWMVRAVPTHSPARLLKTSGWSTGIPKGQPPCLGSQSQLSIIQDVFHEGARYFVKSLPLRRPHKFSTAWLGKRSKAGRWVPFSGFFFKGNQTDRCQNRGSPMLDHIHSKNLGTAK